MFFKNKLKQLLNIYNTIDIYVSIFDKNYNYVISNKKMLKDFVDKNSNPFFNFLSNCKINIKSNNNEELLKSVLKNEIKYIKFDGLLHNIYYKPNVVLINNYYVISFTRYTKEEEINFYNNKINNKVINELIDSYPLPIFYKDKYGYYINCNNKFVTFLNKNNKNEILGKNIYELETNKELANIYEQRDNKLLNHKIDKNYVETYEFTYSFKKTSGIAYIYKSLYFNEVNEIEGIIGVIVDTSKYKQLENKLKKENFNLSLALQKDYLTGIFNKLAFDLKLKERINFYNRYKNKGTFILFFIDIDHFKLINNEYGNNIGDNVLKQFTVLISDFIRKTDNFYRIENNKFALILEGINLTKAKIVANKLLNLIQNHKIKIINNKNITISIAINEYNNKLNISSDKTIKLFLNEINKTLLEVKKNGRNQFKILTKFKNLK